MALDQKQMDNILRTTSSINDAVSSLIDKQTRYNKLYYDNISNFRKSEKNLEAMNKALEHRNVKQKEFDVLTSTMGVTQRKEAKRYYKLIKENEGMAKKLTEQAKEELKIKERSRKQAERILKIQEGRERKKAVRETLGKIPGVKKAAEWHYKGQDAKEGAKGLSRNLKWLGSKGGKLAGTFKLLGGAVGKAVPIIGGAVAAFEAFKFVAKTINKLDKFAKGLNQEFLKMAGPVVGLGGVADKAREFNKALFDLNRNLQRGIGYSDIQKLFGAMAASGLSTQGVVQRIGSYEKAINNAKDLSVSFGVSFESMGTMMSDQMVTLNSSLEQVNDSFTRMAYDAAKAGISSEKFYQSIMAGASSLSLFGDRLKFISGLKAKYLEIGMGEKDAGEAANEAAGAFKDYMNNLKAIQVMGVGEAQRIAKMVVEAKDAEIDSKQEARKAAEERKEKATTSKGRSEAQGEIDRLSRDLKLLYRERGGMGFDTEEQIARTMMLANEKFIDMFKIAFLKGGNIRLGGGVDELYARKMLESFNMGNEFEVIQQAAQMVEESIRQAFEVGGLGGLDKADKELLNTIKGLEDSIKEGADPAKIIPQIKEALISAGVGADQADALADLAKSFPYATSKILENNNKSVKQIIDLLSDQITAYVVSSSNMKDIPKAQPWQIDEAEEISKTMERQFQITKEQAMYLASDNNAMKTISKTVFGIFNFMTSRWGPGKDDKQKGIEKARGTYEYQAASQAIQDRTALRESISSLKNNMGDKLGSTSMGVVEKIAEYLKGSDVNIDNINESLDNLNLTLSEDLKNNKNLIPLIDHLKALQKANETVDSYTAGKESYLVNNLHNEANAKIRAAQEELDSQDLTEEEIKSRREDKAKKAVQSQGVTSDLDNMEYAERIKKFIADIVKPKEEDLSWSGRGFPSPIDRFESEMKRSGKNREEAMIEILAERMPGWTWGGMQNKAKELLEQNPGLKAHLLNLIDTHADTQSSQEGGQAKMKDIDTQKVRDGLAQSSGILGVERGDIIVKNNKLANAVSSSTGGLVNKLLRESDFKPGIMKTPGNTAMSWGDINIYSNGDSDDIRTMIPELKRAFQDSVEQSIRKYRLKETSY